MLGNLVSVGNYLLISN